MGISRRGVLEWSAISTDLIPLDFFLWGRLKNKFDQTQTENIQDLKNTITAKNTGDYSTDVRKRQK